MIVGLNLLMLNKRPSDHHLIDPPRNTRLHNLIIGHGFHEHVIGLDAMGAFMVDFLLDYLCEVLLDGHYADVLVVGVVFQEVLLLVEKVVQKHDL